MNPGFRPGFPGFRPGFPGSVFFLFFIFQPDKKTKQI